MRLIKDTWGNEKKFTPLHITYDGETAIVEKEGCGRPLTLKKDDLNKLNSHGIFILLTAFIANQSG